MPRTEPPVIPGKVALTTPFNANGISKIPTVSRFGAPTRLPSGTSAAWELSGLELGAAHPTSPTRTTSALKRREDTRTLAPTGPNDLWLRLRGSRSCAVETVFLPHSAQLRGSQEE